MQEESTQNLYSKMLIGHRIRKQERYGFKFIREDENFSIRCVNFTGISDMNWNRTHEEFPQRVEKDKSEGKTSGRKETNIRCDTGR